jgi:hypothetical protein
MPYPLPFWCFSHSTDQEKLALAWVLLYDLTIIL